MSFPLRIGPFGRCVGCAFDEGRGGGIRKVIIYHSKLGIHRILTMSNEGLTHSHGISCEAHVCCIINLAERETIDFVSGTSGSIIYSLTLTTSLGRHYGPYGSTTGYPFGFSGPVLGFFGHCDEFLRALGCHSDAYFEP